LRVARDAPAVTVVGERDRSVSGWRHLGLDRPVRQAGLRGGLERALELRGAVAVEVAEEEAAELIEAGHGERRDERDRQHAEQEVGKGETPSDSPEKAAQELRQQVEQPQRQD